MTETTVLNVSEEKVYTKNEYPINVPGHRILIRYQCWKCGRIKGRVKNNGRWDKEDVFYQRSLIILPDGGSTSLPSSICPLCKDND